MQGLLTSRDRFRAKCQGFRLDLRRIYEGSTKEVRRKTFGAQYNEVRIIQINLSCPTDQVFITNEQCKVQNSQW